MTNPLTFHHAKIGAILGPNGVPLRYADAIDEYRAVTDSAGIADISHLGRLRVGGKDRVSFLNGLLTNDISKLKEGGGIHSALLNTKARVLADLHLYAQPETIIVDTGDRPSSQVKQILDGFIITEDVRVEDISASTVVVTVQGKSSASVIKEILKLGVDNLRPLETRGLGPSLIISRDRTGRSGFDLLIPADEAESVWQSFLLKGEPMVHLVGLEALEILRLEAGLPKYGVDVREDTIVLEAGYQDAISFTKGCYLGQEVVARATHIGRVNRRLVQLQIGTKERLGMDARVVAKGETVGSVTSSAFSPGWGKTVALGYVGRDFTTAGYEVEVTSAGKELHAVVSKIL